MPAVNRPSSFFLLALCAAALLATLVLWLQPGVEDPDKTGELWKAVRFFGMIICATVALVIILWGALTYHLKPTEFTEKKDIVQLIAEILGGTTLIITLLSTWQGVRENEAKAEESRQASVETMRVTQLTLNEARQRQQAERYARAAEQLGSQNRGTRIAAIYALGQLASDSDEFYWPIIQMLTSYVADNAVWKGEAARPADQIPSDVQAAMNVLAHRKKRWDPSREAPTPEAPAPEATAEETGEAVETTVCKDSHPPGEAPTPRCRENDVLELRGLDLRGLILKHRDSDLQSGAHFEGAKLDGVRLDSGATNLRGIHLEHAVLNNANLRGAYLSGAYLDGAGLEGADIHGTDFSLARGLTPAQVLSAKNYECAKLDQTLHNAVEKKHGQDKCKADPECGKLEGAAREQKEAELGRFKCAAVKK